MRDAAKRPLTTMSWSVCRISVSYIVAKDRKKGVFHCLCRLPPAPFFDGPARRYVHDPVSRHLAKPRHRNQLKPNCEIVRFWLITFNLFYSVAGLFGSAINAESVTRGVRIWLLSGVVGCEIYEIVSWVWELSEITWGVQERGGGGLNKSFTELVFHTE